MKKILLIIAILLTALSSKAQQIIPLEEQRKYMDEEIEVDDGTYFKDINHLLDKYEGTWKGIYSENGYTYEFRIKKRVYNGVTRPLKIDELMMRYRITDNNGKEILSTYDLPDDSPYTIIGNYLDEVGHYVLSYIGFEAECGQSGDVFIGVLDGSNGQKMQLFVYPSIDLVACKKIAEQILPRKVITLTKQ